MQKFSDFEREQSAWLKKKQMQDMECISCPNCGSQWFYEVEVSQYKADHHLVVGQKVPPKPGTIPYQLLKCIVCQDMLEPRILHNQRDVAGGGYDYLLDTIEGKHDKRKKATKEAELEEEAKPAEEEKDEVQDKEQ